MKLQDIVKVYLLEFNIQFIFSERELMFMFAICRRPSVCLSVCLSVCRLSVVCRLKRSCTLLSRLKFSATFLRLVIRW